ncbi:hypothetical protein AVEN_165503-1 [Araneus ventricosus]|uniref:Uncharacterized protein n=1 Tax=Araneus ventricosus TaxID=182803 RepID=A0A4Y2JZF0_ARAVE|nr:hypothetical protein AVEN_165503-1 [Araneus ventricosus]
MTRTTPELASPLQTSTSHKREDVWLSTYDLTCNRPHTRRIFSGIGFRTWNPPVPRPRPYHYATEAFESAREEAVFIFISSHVLEYDSSPKYFTININLQ